MVQSSRPSHLHQLRCPGWLLCHPLDAYVTGLWFLAADVLRWCLATTSSLTFMGEMEKRCHCVLLLLTSVIRRGHEMESDDIYIHIKWPPSKFHATIFSNSQASLKASNLRLSLRCSNAVLHTLKIWSNALRQLEGREANGNKRQLTKQAKRYVEWCWRHIFLSSCSWEWKQMLEHQNFCILSSCLVLRTSF